MFFLCLAFLLLVVGGGCCRTNGYTCYTALQGTPERAVSTVDLVSECSSKATAQHQSALRGHLRPGSGVHGGTAVAQYGQSTGGRYHLEIIDMFHHRSYSFANVSKDRNSK